MEAVQKKPRTNSLECHCEINQLNHSKKFTLCDICSEKKFLKQLSSNNLKSDSDSFDKE